MLALHFAAFSCDCHPLVCQDTAPASVAALQNNLCTLVQRLILSVERQE
jgi:hypothetical protein